MADITPLLPPDRQLIQSYGGGGFRIAGQDYIGSVLVQPQTTLEWPLTDASAIDFPSLAPLIRNVESSGGAVLLIGTGQKIVSLGGGVRQELRGRGVGLEIMDTGAACRTFNVLLAEERAVVAALIAVS